MADSDHYALRVTAAEALRTLADEAARDLASLTDEHHYNARGNHDSMHLPKDLESNRAIRAVVKAETVLRLLSGLIADADTERERDDPYARALELEAGKPE